MSARTGRPVEAGFAVLAAPDRQGAEEGERTYVRRNGERFPAELSLTTLRDAAGTVTGYVGVVQEISDRKKAEADLIQAKAAAESATLAKSQFLANMSHEIRTPMNAVIGMTELLLNTSLSSEQRDYAQTISMAGESLLTVINGILDFSRIEAGKLELEHAPFDLNLCVEEAMDLIAAKAADKGLETAWLPEPGTPGRWIGDGGRVRQILVNLLGNAVKFTEDGEIVVSARARPTGGNWYELQISVRDSGIGIPAGRLDRLFQSFSQVD